MNISDRLRSAESQARNLVAIGRRRRRTGRVAREQAHAYRTSRMLQDSAIPMSEWVLIGGLFLAIVLTRLNTVVALELNLLTKYLPGMMLFAGATLSALASAIYPKRKAVSDSITVQPIAMLWPLLVFCLEIIVGSSYGQQINNVDNSFRNMGIYGLTAYVVARTMRDSHSAVQMVSTYMLLVGLAAAASILAMAPVFILTPMGLAPFHELEFMIFPLAVYWISSRPELRLRDHFLVWVWLASSILFRKNSAYLSAAVTLLYVWLLLLQRERRPGLDLARALWTYAAGLVLLGLVGAYAYIRASKPDFVPAGSVEFRMFTYERAWQKFLKSPLWGNGYVDSATERFTLYDTGVAGNNLPTHSDVLDILANGGVLSFGLWGLAHAILLYYVYRHILKRDSGLSRIHVALAHTLVCMVVAGILTYAFNPLLLNPVRALLVWAQFGMLAGLVCVATRGDLVAKPTQATT